MGISAPTAGVISTGISIITIYACVSYTTKLTGRLSVRTTSTVHRRPTCLA